VCSCGLDLNCVRADRGRCQQQDQSLCRAAAAGPHQRPHYAPRWRGVEEPGQDGDERAGHGERLAVEEEVAEATVALQEVAAHERMSLGQLKHIWGLSPLLALMGATARFNERDRKCMW